MTGLWDWLAVMCRYQRCPWTTTRGGAPAQLPWLSTLITFLILKTGLVLLFHHDLRREISHRGGARVMALWLSCVVLLMALWWYARGRYNTKALEDFYSLHLPMAVMHLSLALLMAVGAAGDPCLDEHDGCANWAKSGECKKKCLTCLRTRPKPLLCC